MLYGSINFISVIPITSKNYVKGSIFTTCHCKTVGRPNQECSGLKNTGMKDSTGLQKL